MMSDFEPIITAANKYAAQDHKLFINGQFLDSRQEETISSINPSTGKSWVRVQAGGVDDMEAAIVAAQNCFDNGWSKTSPKERERLIRRFADLLERDGEIIAAIDAHDGGSLIAGAKNIVNLWLDAVHYFAGWPTKVTGQSFALTPQPFTDSLRSMQTIMEPIGVVGCILPWNAPAQFMVNKVVPALAAGCTTVVKPAEETPLSALYIASLFREAGFPDGAVNVVNGYGNAVGPTLSSHPLVKKISFTGSTEVGRKIAIAAAPTFKRLTLELGGKSAFIVMDDADIDKAALYARVMGYGNAGQFCMCPSRLFLEESIRDKFIERLTALAGDIIVGDALSGATTMGPVITAADRDRIAGVVDKAREDGADLVYGGERIESDGNFYKPTLLSHGTTDIEIAKEEVFGPVLMTTSFKKDDIDGLVARANETRFGLSASIWTQDISLGRRMMERLEAGTVTVNCHAGIDTVISFGGIKDSGIGREYGREGFESFFETKGAHLLV